MKRLLILALTVATTLTFTGCPQKPAPKPEAFTGSLETIEGIHAIVSVRHPKLILQDFQHLVSAVPEAGIVSTLLAMSGDKFGYPNFAEIKDSANSGIVILDDDFARIQTPATVLFIKLKPRGKLRRNLFTAENGWHTAEHKEWTILSRDETALRRIKNPDAIIARLSIPQTEELLAHGQLNPGIIPFLKTNLLRELAKFELNPDDKTALAAYAEIVLDLLAQIHSAGYALDLNETGIQLRATTQFLPDTPLGTAARYRSEHPVADAQHLPDDALVSAVIRYEPKAAADLHNYLATRITAVDYPGVSEPLKKIFDAYIPFLKANQGASALLMDFRFTGDFTRPLITNFITTSATTLKQDALDKTFLDAYAASEELLANIKNKLPKKQRADFVTITLAYKPAALKISGLDFAKTEATAKLHGETLPQTQYVGLHKNTLIAAGEDDKPLQKYLPAFIARNPLENSLAQALPLATGQIARVSLNGGKLLDLIATYEQFPRLDSDTLANLRTEFTEAGPIILNYETRQAALTIDTQIPYKFIAAILHLTQAAKE